MSPVPATTQAGDPAVRTRITVVTLDTLGERMAGPAIRAWEISRALSQEHDVALVTFGRCSREGEGFTARRIEVGEFQDEVARADVVVIQGFVFNAFPWLATCDQVIVIDLYDPFQIETLEVDKYKPSRERHRALGFALGELAQQLRRGDFFLCASSRQRDLWIGHLSAAGRINPETYDADPTLDSLIAIVPFGTPDEPPVRTRHAIKGAIPGIGPDDKVVLWGGGVYNWFDPLTLVRAIDVLRADVPEVRLFFQGMKHPNPDVPEMDVATRCRRLSDELGLTGRFVFFNEGWVPYSERGDYLLDADVGVSCHFQHVETEFSFRTRILDYLWAGLPIVTTAGDAFATMVEKEDAGIAVPAEDVDALASALRLALTSPLDRERYRANVRRLAERFPWPVVLEPLVEFCRAPVRAADAERIAQEVTSAPPLPRRILSSDLRSVVRVLRSDGIGQVAAKVRWRLAHLRAARRL